VEINKQVGRQSERHAEGSRNNGEGSILRLRLQSVCPDKKKDRERDRERANAPERKELRNHLHRSVDRSKENLDDYVDDAFEAKGTDSPPFHAFHFLLALSRSLSRSLCVCGFESNLLPFSFLNASRDLFFRWSFRLSPVLLLDPSSFSPSDFPPSVSFNSSSPPSFLASLIPSILPELPPAPFSPASSFLRGRQPVIQQAGKKERRERRKETKKER